MNFVARVIALFTMVLADLQEQGRQPVDIAAQNIAQNLRLFFPGDRREIHGLAA